MSARRAPRRPLGAALVAALASAVALGSGAGCSTAKVNDAPDAKPQFDCKPDPILFCNPLPAGTPGCVGFPDSPDGFLQRLPADKAFGEGCVANFVKRDIRVEEVCGLAAVCDCVRVDDTLDASPPVDARPDASPVPDANPPVDASDASDDGGAEAGPAADAGPEPDAAPTVDASPPPAEAGAPRPIRLAWRCR